MTEVSQILQAIDRKDYGSADKLLPVLYNELRRMAQKKLAKERWSDTLDATGLVHEAYLRLVGNEEVVGWDGRARFFGAAAEAMRRIRIDRARARHRQKREGNRLRCELREEAVPVPTTWGSKHDLVLDWAMINDVPGHPRGCHNSSPRTV